MHRAPPTRSNFCCDSDRETIEAKKERKNETLGGAAAAFFTVDV